MEDVVKRVLASVQSDLYDNLPLEEDFIIRLQNEHLINHSAATELRALARNGDQSCIQDLITYMRNFFDEATLNKFCTFLDKYGQDDRPLMIKLAAKISWELKDSPKTRLGKRGVGERSHSEKTPPVTELPQATCSATYPGPKRLRSQECTQVPLAPTALWTGMDEEIDSAQDIVGVRKYKKGLINKLTILGAALDIGDETDAILTRNETPDAQLLKILTLYIEVKSPTWRDFCKALKKSDRFNNVRGKIEAGRTDPIISH